MEVKIGIGVDNIVFGMTQEEVDYLWGKPNKVSKSELENGVVYYYNDKMIKFNFDGEYGYKLYSIEIFHPQLLILGKSVINETKENIISILNESGYVKTEYEDYDFFDTIFCEDIWSTFRFEFNMLKSIEFSPLYDDNDEMIWPEKSTC